MKTEAEPEGSMDRLVALACVALGCPRGLVSVFGPEETVFQSAVGVDVQSIPSDVSVTRILMQMGPSGLLVFEDGQTDPRVKDHPMVTGEPYLRFYAGATICNERGEAVGSIAVMDIVPRGPLSDTEIQTLRRFAGLAGDLIDQAAATRRSNEQLELLQLAEQMSGIGRWRFDIVTGKVDWSDEVYRIHGLSRETYDPSYGGAVSFYHPDDKPLLTAAVERAIATGEGYALSMRLNKPGGEEMLVAAQAATQRDKNGNTVALFGVFQDVTEAVRAKERIESSEALFRLLSEKATDIVTRYAPDGTFLYVSPAVETVLGRTAASMVGQRGKAFIHPDDFPMVRRHLETYLAAGAAARSPRYEYRAIRADGEIVWLEASPRGVFDADGQVIEFHDHVRDVTERKALEHQLIEARDRAEAGAMAKSEFLANMSHELRTPLTSVIGFSGLLAASEALPDAERLYASRIATASDALLSVINDILDYSKLEAEAVDLEPQPFDPRAMAHGAAAIVEDLVRAKGLTLIVEAASDLAPGLMGDEGRLRQVILNFLSNAVKFTGAGTVTLRVSDADGRLRVTVTDTGIGIAAAKIDTLFDRFTQADASTTRVYGGTGLGLAISRRLIDIMGGTIGAQSTLGEGSTFWFEVPLPVAGPKAAAVTGPVATGLPAGVRILMADDAPANRELVTAILTSFEVDLDAVEDGAKAVEAAGRGGYDLILMDVHMPVMDGLDATRAIRAMSGPASRTPIVALTANIQPQQVERCRDAGMDAHVGKPIQVDELLQTIASALARRRDETGQEAAA